MNAARIAAAAILAFVLSAGASAQDEAPLPEGNAYVRGVLSSPNPQDAAINDYAYDLEETREDLDRDLRTTSRQTRRYEVYFVRTRPVRRLVSINGVPLSVREQAEIDRKAEAQAKAIAEGRTVSEQAGIRLASLLDSFDFKTAGRQTRDGRPTLILDFKPRPEGARPPSRDRAAAAVTRILSGQVSIDEGDRRVVLLDARNTPGESASVATGVRLGTFQMTMEYSRVEEHVWLPRKVVTVVTGRAFFFKTFRVRRTTTYSNYRRFTVNTKEQ